MEKKIYCAIGQRCKRITFLSQKHIPDVQIVRDRLIEASNNDIVLQSMMKNKIIILQKIDKNDKLCDIEEDEEIEDKSEVKVLLFETLSDTTAEAHTSITSDIIPKKIDETYAINVVHTEPINIKDTELLMQDMEKSIVIDGEEVNISYTKIFI